MNKNIFLYLLMATVLVTACGKMYDNIEQYAGEIVYPGKFDTISAKIGFERVELDLVKAGRIPSSQMNLGKSKKTVVEYEDKKIVIDSLVSWVNITGLTQSKLYRIKVYTIDEFDNQSVPQEIGVIPYTESDLSLLQMSTPRVLASPGNAVLDWPTGLSSILSNYYTLSYSYKDKDGAVKEGDRAANPRIFMANLNPGVATPITLNYKIVPKVNNAPILDTVILEEQLQINIPTASTPFKPVEEATLRTNGVTNFTANGTSSVQKLVFPVTTSSLQDVFYFPNLKEVDLTGGTMFNMATTAYNRNGIVKTIGGGPLVSFARRLGDMPAANVNFLIDLMDVGQVTKVKYLRNSMGIDALLQPYVDRGIVEIIGKPDEELIPLDRFFMDGVVQDNAWKMELTVPMTSGYPAGTDLKNVIKAIMRAKNGSFIISLPTQYEFDVKEYPYIRFSVYGPPKSAISGTYAPYQILWPRFMNYLWAFTTESPYGQQSWDLGKVNYKIPDAALQTWHEMRLDLAQSLDKHNRVFVMNIGGEPALTYAPTVDMVYYFANFRFSKN